MVKDCFPYFNEKELLELRIKLLYDYVDEFVICDANKTHSGNPKEYTLRKTLLELGIPMDKIRIVEVDMPDKETEPNDHVREAMQRDAASKYIGEDDVAFICDCDEIINPELISYYVTKAKQHKDKIILIPMVFLTGRADLQIYFNNTIPLPWAEAFICLGNHIEKYTLTQIRNSHIRKLFNLDFQEVCIVENGVVENAGWHFSWMGDSERRKLKYKSFCHYNDYIPTAYGSGTKEDLENFIGTHSLEEGSTDPLGRHDHVMKKYDISNLPKKIFELPNVKSFLFQE